MSDITKEPPVYAKYVDSSDELVCMDQAEADFDYWSRLPLWSNEEGIALLLGKDPEVVNWDVIRGYVNDPCYSSDLCSEYNQLRKVVVRALKFKEIEAWNTPDFFVAWAVRMCLDIPEELQEAMAARPTHLEKTPSDSDNLISSQAQEIIALKEQVKTSQQRILALEASQWPGFDKNKETYAEELAIAFEVYSAVTQDWHKGRSVKQQLMAWLKQQYPKLSKEATERISKICNWQKEGGAPLTP